MPSLLEQAKSNREAARARLNQINRAVEARASKTYTPEEDREFEEGAALVKGLDLRIVELGEAEQRDVAARKVGVSSGWSVTGEPDIYRDPLKDPSTPSFFSDMYYARQGDRDAIDRLGRHKDASGGRDFLSQQTRDSSRSAYYALEKRAGDMTTVAGAGGELAPPLWMVEDFVALARAGRVTADLLNKDTLPSGVSSINLPKVASGATVAVQQTQNSALSDTAMTTTSISSGIVTIGGKQIVALQLITQSGIPFDRVILSDLAKAYAVQLDTQVLNGSGVSGQLRGLGVNATVTAYTTATPKFVDSTTNANSFYSAVIRAAETVGTTLYAAPTVIVMHNRRWAWCQEALDGNGRPMITPNGQIFNAAGTQNGVVPQGAAGTLAGLPVYVDPNISVTANSTTNQDEVYVMKADEAYLWEKDLQLASFDATYADQASLLFRALGYAAAIPDRYVAAVNVLRGTGLVTPTL